MIQQELGDTATKCVSFEINHSMYNITIILVNSVSLRKVAHVIVELKYLYDHRLLSYSVKNNTFAYLIYTDV
jgi:hypothetical protein